MRFTLTTLCFTSTTVKDVQSPNPVIVVSSARPPTQWVFGDGTVKAMPKRMVPFYMTNSSPRRSPKRQT
ncbi:hypothetical protein ANCCAN_15435 [Ancylostoma caninum]|uniref:Uncharacterized protein n=1 Tax=Ancylostoma caninum TaxID=29170 RepID=A0A368G2I8_ANCCA|nr:hypothetical protein ANCCAN_15435 [Ancylostoma caninum]